MSRTEYDPTPHAQDVPHVQDATIPPPAPLSEDSEQRHALAAFVHVTLAVQARAMHRARAVAQAAPDVRVARVEAARRALQEGTLTLDGPALADKLLQVVCAERRHA
jgi:flagellar biosynthesis anti-sigma factor FlgM